MTFILHFLPPLLTKRKNNKEELTKMLKESINASIDYLYNSCEVSLALELIRDALSGDIIEKESVTDILNEIAQQDSDIAAIEEAIEIMRDFEIEVSSEVRHRQFVEDIKSRLGELVRFVKDEDLTKIAQSRIDGIAYDLSEYLNQISE